jgi:hypothetical protein
MRGDEGRWVVRRAEGRDERGEERRREGRGGEERRGE